MTTAYFYQIDRFVACSIASFNRSLLVFPSFISLLSFFGNTPQLPERLEAFSCWKRTPAWRIGNDPLEGLAEIYFSIYSGIPISHEQTLDWIFRTYRENSSQNLACVASKSPFFARCATETLARRLAKTRFPLFRRALQFCHQLL